MRAHKVHVRPEGPVGAWRASHAMLWGRGADAPWQRRRRAGDAGAAGAPLRGDGKALYKAARAAVLYVLLVLYVLPRRPRLPV